MSVYFIKNTRTGSLKIGLSVNPESRLATLQTGNEDKLVIEAVIPNADVSVEKRLHEDWGYLRSRGEWFAPDKALTEFIGQLKLVVNLYETHGQGVVDDYQWFSDNGLLAWRRVWLLALGGHSQQ